MSVNEELRKILVTGLGAMVLSKERIKELLEASSAKGEVALEQYKLLNQELKRTVNIKLSVSDKDEDAATAKTDPEGLSLAQILEGIESLTPEEQEALAGKLTALRQE